MHSLKIRDNGTMSDEMEMWKEKCSICFDNNCDFSFASCGDQFCCSCIRRYFNEVISNSWGLLGCKMKCPVCYIILEKNVWTKFAEKKTIENFEAINKPYRPFSRFCSICTGEVVVAPHPCETPEKRNDLIQSIFEILKNELYPEDKIEMIHRELYQVQEGKFKSITDVYQNISRILLDNELKEDTVIHEAKKRKFSPVSDLSSSSILIKIIQLETNSDKWRQLQYLHIKAFPKLQCGKCFGEMCFSCGDSSWHYGSSCKENIQRKLAVSQYKMDSDSYATLQWTIQHSKRCPNCSVLINRDDGCNRMDCLHCGFSFCWVCEGKWTSSCGFYKCKESKNVEKEKEKEKGKGREKEKEKDASKSKPELGVPNVILIEQKISSSGTLRKKVSSQPKQEKKGYFMKDWLLISRFFF